jgi:short-subunit dehydrogenase
MSKSTPRSSPDSTFLSRLAEHGTRAHILKARSIYGLIAVPHVGPYTASQFPIVRFAKVPRQELADSDIDGSLLIPGSVLPTSDME